MKKLSHKLLTILLTVLAFFSMCITTRAADSYLVYSQSVTEVKSSEGGEVSFTVSFEGGQHYTSATVGFDLSELTAIGATITKKEANLIDSEKWTYYRVNYKNDEAIPMLVAAGLDGETFEENQPVFRVTVSIPANAKEGTYAIYTSPVQDVYDAPDQLLKQTSKIQVMTLVISGDEPIETYDVTYYPNGGSGTMTGASASYTKGSAATISACGYTAPEGKEFSHWTTKANGTGTKYNPGDSVTVNGAINLYAQWKASTVTVTFNSNGGTSVAAQTITSGGTVTKPADPTRSGYTFDGWYSNKSCTTEWNFATKVTKDITLYAGWIKGDSDITPVDPTTECDRSVHCPAYPFKDLDLKLWYHDGIHYCVEKKLMQGISASQFDPSGNTTRAMIVTILWRMEGSPRVNYSMTFKDVPAGQWYTDAIRWAQSTGVVKGYSAQEFGPTDQITREQIATILYRFAKYKGYDCTKTGNISGFTDRGSISDWAMQGIRWAYGNGMLYGKGNGILDPGGKATRAETAALIQRFCTTFWK